MVYFKPEYVELYMQKNERLFYYDYIVEKKHFKHVCIRDNHNIYTPYGYGGYKTNIKDPKLFYGALMRYEDYCMSVGVKLETVKWHPYNTVVKYCLFDHIKSDRNLAVVDLTLTKEERWETYGASTRNILRKEGFIVERTEDIALFKKLYRATMDKHNAGDFYYFNDDYFKRLMTIDDVVMYQVVNNGNVLSMGIFFLSLPIASYHLSANNQKYRHLNGNYYLLESLFDIAQEHGNTSFLLGGGRSGDRFDSLLLFKQKFTKKTRDYYITETRYL